MNLSSSVNFKPFDPHESVFFPLGDSACFVGSAGPSMTPGGVWVGPDSDVVVLGDTKSVLSGIRESRVIPLIRSSGQDSSQKEVSMEGAEGGSKRHRSGTREAAQR